MHIVIQIYDIFHMSTDKILSFKRLFLLSMQFLGWEALRKKNTLISFKKKKLLLNQNVNSPHCFVRNSQKCILHLHICCNT